MPWPLAVVTVVADFTFFLSTEFNLGQYLAFPVPDSMAEPAIPPCALQRLTSDPNTYVDECGLNQDVSKALDLLYCPGN